jgi:hypothetical protein
MGMGSSPNILESNDETEYVIFVGAPPPNHATLRVKCLFSAPECGRFWPPAMFEMQTSEGEQAA